LKKLIDYLSFEFLKLLKHNKNVILNQIYSSLSFVVNVIVSIFTIKLVTTYISPDSFGIYQYVLSVSALCTISTISGINKTITGYVTKGFHGTVKVSTVMSVKTGVIGILILIGFGLYSFYVKSNLLESTLFFIAAIFFIPYRIFPRYQSILAGLNKFKDKLLMQSAFTIFNLALGFIVLVIFHQDILVYALSQLAFQSFCFTFFFIITYKKLSNKNIDDEYLNHSLIISLIGLGSDIIVPGIQIYLNYALGPSFLALYAIANKMTSSIGGAIKSIVSPVVIKLASKSEVEHKEAVFRLIPLLLLFGIIIYGFVFLAIDIVGPLLVDKQYNDSLYYAKLLTLVLIFSPLFAILRGNILFEKNNKGYAYSIYAEQGFQLIGYVIFISKFGIPAIGVVNFFASASAIAMMLFSIKKLDI